MEEPTSQNESNSVSALLAMVRANAEVELEFCDEESTPNVCAMIQTPDGRKKIIDLICEYVGNNGMSISEAIVSIERERSVNSLQ